MENLPFVVLYLVIAVILAVRLCLFTYKTVVAQVAEAIQEHRAYRSISDGGKDLAMILLRTVLIWGLFSAVTLGTYAFISWLSFALVKTEMTPSTSTIARVLFSLGVIVLLVRSWSIVYGYVLYGRLQKMPHHQRIATAERIRR